MESKSKKIYPAAPSKPAGRRVVAYVKGSPEHAAAVARGVKFEKMAAPLDKHEETRPKVKCDLTEFFEAMNPPVKPRSPYHIWTAAADFRRQMLSQPGAVAIVSKQLACAARRARAGA